MRIVTTAGAMALVFTTTTLVAAPANARDLVTAPRAILCLDADHVEAANAGRQDQDSLRQIQCMRTGAGIRTVLMSGNAQSAVWQVRFQPEGIPGGVTLWARPSAFTEPDGTPVGRRQASR